jgi:hypothetical protein
MNPRPDIHIVSQSDHVEAVRQMVGAGKKTADPYPSQRVTVNF